MKTRIIVGAALSCMLVAMLAFGGYVMLTAVALVSMAAVYEMSLAFQKKGFHPWMISAYLCGGVMPYVYAFFGVGPVLALLMASAMTAMAATLFSRERNGGDIIAAVFVHVYPLTFLFIALLVYFEFPRPIGLTAACMAFAGPEVCDTFAYFGGTLLGKRKLCPRISPKKTVAGSVSALIGGVAFGLVLFYLQRLWEGITGLWPLLLLGLGCGVLSQFGDLVASTIKRWAGIKDFSSLFPGHGGIIDRIDSILFCAPLVFCAFTILTQAYIY